MNKIPAIVMGLTLLIVLFTGMYFGEKSVEERKAFRHDCVNVKQGEILESNRGEIWCLRKGSIIQ